MTAFKSDFLNILQSRGFIHQISDPDSLDALAAKGDAVAYVGYDCTAASLHVGHLLSIMMLHWLQQTGNKPIALMGGGTTRVGDPSGRDETRKILTYEQIDANKDSIKGTFAKILQVRRRQERRHHGRQCRVADQAQLHRDAARRRPAFLGQPHADHGFGQDAARARAGAVVHRIQLHDPAVLRFRRAGAALRLQSADGRLRPVGQHRQRRRSRPPHGHASTVRADLPAADHLVRRQDGQDRRRRGLAQRRHAVAPTTTGSTGATPRTPTSSAS